MVRVLVPIDGSQQATAALTEAFELFPDAKIHVVHVVQVTRIPSDPGTSPYEYAREKGETILQEAKTIAAESDRTIETSMTEGHVARTILRYIEDRDIEYVVMGSRGRSGVSRVLLGSVAETVTRRSPVSVVIVR
ncbi:universal stress protein UspA [Natrinema saccharevitans]|uniref:Universal stress protein UspA n=1 Tax=Natrinema saccharevitans TaxID=301967 RepID=A0A1S8B1B1_9EURY|nr:universal stress protein [Natrinema saccharevitans]OLZ42636.1 universal stress protein UspA [Natrinema saccharevitans]